MRTLDRKLLRELRETKAQSLAIALVIASGVAVFVMSLNTLGFLRETRDAYYDRYRFGHLFASVRRAPQPLEERIVAIAGIAAVQTRIVSDVTLDVEGLDEPAVGRLVSLPLDNVSTLNSVYLRRGRFPEPDRVGEVLVSDAFFEANSLSIGDQIDAVLNGRLQPLTIVGVALSPEYVIQIRGGDLLPDDRRFGIFWMPHRQMEAAFDMDGAFNNVSVRLLRGADEEDVIDQMDAVLKPYDAIGAYGRDQHISARFLADEIKQLRATGMVAPAIFMAVSAVVGSIRAVGGAVRLLPAEAMQPIAPTMYRRSLLERFGLTSLIPVAARMVLRGLQRRPFSAMLSSIGIAFSVSVLVLSGFFNDAIDYLIEFQFSTAQRQDVQVIFNLVTSPRARHDLRHFPGVQRVEPFRAVAVNLRNEHRDYRTSILGLDHDRELYRLLNTESKPIRLSASGIVLSDKIVYGILCRCHRDRRRVQHGAHLAR